MGRPKKHDKPNHKICEVCGNQFYVKPSQYDKIKCCSVECGKTRRKYSMPKGKDHYNWSGGRSLNKENGYMMIKMEGHPGCNSRGYIYEHRYVMEQHLGRLLEPWEIVHHKDGNKLNNNIENLELMTQSEHAKLHGLGKEIRKD